MAARGGRRGSYRMARMHHRITPGRHAFIGVRGIGRLYDDARRIDLQFLTHQHAKGSRDPLSDVHFTRADMNRAFGVKCDPAVQVGTIDEAWIVHDAFPGPTRLSIAALILPCEPQRQRCDDSASSITSASGFGSDSSIPVTATMKPGIQ